MEYTLHEPVNRQPRQQYVGLEELSDKSPAAIVAENDINPASPEYIDYLWQREAAISALNGIKEVAGRGLHRRKESFAEMARYEIGIRAKRLFGKIASVGSGIREWGTAVREHVVSIAGSYGEEGSLAELGFAGTVVTERHWGDNRKNWAAHASVPDSPAEVTSSFSAEELAELRRVVQERRQEHGVRIYESQNR